MTALMVLSACSDRQPPAAPTETDPLVGTWSGAVLDQVLGAGTFKLVIRGKQQSSPLAAGEWSVDFASRSIAGGGTAPPYTVAADGSVTLFCRCVNGSVGLQLQLDGDVLRGNYLGFGCPILSAGTLTLAKQ